MFLILIVGCLTKNWRQGYVERSAKSRESTASEKTAHSLVRNLSIIALPLGYDIRQVSNINRVIRHHINGPYSFNLQIPLGERKELELCIEAGICL